MESVGGEGGGDGGECWWRVLVESVGGECWWRMLVERGGVMVESVGGECWWRALVESVGGECWWRGGGCWWRVLVESDGGEGGGVGGGRKMVERRMLVDVGWRWSTLSCNERLGILVTLSGAWCQ